MENIQKNQHPIAMGTEVSSEEKIFLLNGTKKIPIYADHASKYSLAFRYLEDQQFSNSDGHVNLLISNNGDSVELGPCRILPGPYQNGYEGRLVFLHNVYDIERLLKDRKIINLQSAFEDLPAIFARKKRIRTSFQQYTADLSYDLNVYKKNFDDLDSQYLDEPEDVKRSVQQAILDTEGRKFLQFFQTTVDNLGHTVANFNEEEHQIHGFYFRKQLWNFILGCPLMARTNLKPRGYAGDSEMLMMVYRNEYQGDSTFSKLLQKYSVGIPTGDSVRYRRIFIKDTLHKLRQNILFSPKEKTRVLSVACGPAIEIADIISSPQDFEKYHFSLLDQDPLALNDAFQVISDTEKKFGAKAPVAYIKKSVRWMFGKKAIEQDLGRFHFIYSMGLFDYLVPKVAGAVLKRLYQLLVPGGEMVIGNFHVSNPDRHFLEYWGDWHLIYRSEDEFRNLFEEESAAKVSVSYDNAGIQMFLHIKKQTDGT